MDKTLSHRSLTLFYRMEGQLPGNSSGAAGHARSPVSAAPAPILLIHGFAEDGRIWDGQVACLKEKYRLIIPDLPGSGRSSALPGETSMEELAENMVAILDAENIEQAILVGHSMGGYIALAFAEKYPGRLEALGLFHSTAYPDSEEKAALRRKSNEFISRHGAATFIRQSIPNLFAEASLEQHPEWASGLIDRYEGFNPDSLIYYYNAMIRRPDRTATLKHSAWPVLFIIGEKDNTLPLEASLQQAHLPRLSSIHILEKAGHMGMLEEEAASNRILDEFLNFVAARKRNNLHSSFNDHQP